VDHGAVSDLRRLIGLDVDGIHAQVADALAGLGPASASRSQDGASVAAPAEAPTA
jgi:hypothetical protein